MEKTDKTYRCSCCNELKPENDQNFLPWDCSEECNVAVCSTCKKEMDQERHSYVVDMHTR